MSNVTPTNEKNEIVSRDDCHVTRVDTRKLLGKLDALFDQVSSGEPYNKDQIKNAAATTNAMIKVMRYEFDVFKYFDNRMTRKPTSEVIQ